MKRKLVWMPIVFIIIYIIVICVSIVHNSHIKTAIKSNDMHTQYKCEKTNIVGIHDCLLDEENKIKILGGDPFLIYEFEPLDVGLVSVSGIKDYKGVYKLYYAMDEPFSEYRVATTRENNLFVVGERVNTIRVDFENVPVGATYDLSDYVGLVINENLNDIFLSVLIFIVYVVLSLLCFIYFLWKNRVLRMIVAWGYSIIISAIWVHCIFIQTDMLVSMAMLIVACAGLFLAVNKVKFGEEK